MEVMKSGKPHLNKNEVMSDGIRATKNLVIESPENKIL